MILDTLKKRSGEMSNVDSSNSTDPWALVIAKDDEFIKNGLSKRFYQKPDDRTWFDSIQIW